MTTVLVKDANASTASPVVRLARLTLAMAAASIAALSIAGWLGSRWSWSCELACHFRVQYFWALAGLSVVYAVRRRLLPALLLGLVAAANLAVVLPIYWPDQTGAPGGPRLRLVSANVLMTNRNYAALKAVLREAEPDVFALVEVDKGWLHALAPLASVYPHSRWMLQGGRFGIALYSRRPWASIEERSMGPHRAPVLRARFEEQGRSYIVYCTHTMSPATREQAQLRNLELADLARMMAAEREPVVLAGDLNSTGWSPRLADMMAEARLKDSRQGFGIQPSWPAHFLLLGIPIDHCLVSPEIEVRQRHLGNRIGSDHLPIVVELGLPPVSTTRP